MILRRFSQAIREQDWFVVLLEVTIVVVGIFLGLQVDDWNQLRQDRSQELRYLERIKLDLNEDISQIGDAISATSNRIAYGRLLLTAIEDKDVVAEDPAKFVRAVNWAGYTFSPSISSHTFEEVKFNGHLAIIRNETLRDAISGYYVLVRGLEQWHYMREYIQTRYMDANLGVLSSEQAVSIDELDLAVSLEDAMETRERLIQKREFILRIPMAMRTQKTYQIRYQTFLLAAEELKTKISNELESRR